MSAHATSPSGSVDRIDVSVPLRTANLAALRTIAASLGADAGFSIDEIDDVRLGLSEVLSALADGTDDGVPERVTASFVVRPHELEVVIRSDRARGGIELDELASSILSSVLDSYETSGDEITLVKRATEAGGVADA
jgi:hypothetical protein